MRRMIDERIPGCMSRPSLVVPNFVDDPHWTPTEAMGDLVSIGTLEPRKNQAYLLDLVAAARAAGASLTLSLMGDGPDRAALQAKARSFGIEPLVHFHGHVPNAAARLPEYRACIHAARMENLPITLIEAMSRARPVFAAPVGGVPEVFSDHVEGRYIPLEDPTRAAAIVMDWMGSPARMAAAGQAGRERFLRCFETQGVARRLTGFLSQLAVHT
jgi:glycosyltransferase involved in cell wall biosynthesis